MKLDYCVLTSVTRDDLPDQGADHIGSTIEAIHGKLPDCKLEMLIPDFRGEPACIARVVKTPLAVLAHNMETVPRLYKQVRPGAVYERSLRVLEMAKEFRSDILTKSGLMLGLGETREELQEVFRDLRQHGCDILTLGQYLRPTEDQLTVTRYVTPEEFALFKRRRPATRLPPRRIRPPRPQFLPRVGTREVVIVARASRPCILGSVT